MNNTAIFFAIAACATIISALIIAGVIIKETIKSMTKDIEERERKL